MLTTTKHGRLKAKMVKRSFSMDKYNYLIQENLCLMGKERCYMRMEMCLKDTLSKELE
jgi:hypothetical protein